MRLLVIRLSALGDVAILAPVLRARAAANPEVTFLLAAPPMLQPLFADISNVEYLPTPRRQSPHDLARQWRALQVDAVADLHGVPRVRRALRRLCWHGIPIHHVEKQRWQRWQLTRRHCKRLTPLTPAWQRYNCVFDACGLQPASSMENDAIHCLQPRHTGNRIRNIGIAPGSQHQGKTWPFGQMETLVGRLSKDPQNRITLFGGKEDQDMLERWAATYPHTNSMACKGSFADELQAMSQLDVMVTMDSANLHFASALGIPAVSIWGATHPSAGFYGWRQHPDNAVQHSLPCRPCSAYGQKACRYGDYRCLQLISVDEVMERITNTAATVQQSVNTQGIANGSSGESATTPC